MVPWNKSTTTETQVQTPNPDDEAFQRNGQETQEKKTKKAEQYLNCDSKETFRLALGEYRGAVAPLCVLFFGYTCGAISVSSITPDPRVDDWALMRNSVPCICICILYVLFSVVWGPNLMKNRDKLNLRKIMIVYNAFQVAFSSYMFFEVGFAGWFFDYNYFCEPCDYSPSPKALRIASVGWLFFISKIVDFMDTLFFILNKKFSNISMLHVVHHSCMCISMWYGIRYTPGGHITFMGYLNSGVHALMYTYYLLSAFGPALRPYLWWKKYLTKIQLIQFVAIFIHAAQLLFIDCPTVPIGLVVWTCIYAFIFFVLFIDFYFITYHGSAKSQKLLLASTGRKNVEYGTDKTLQNEGVKGGTWNVKNNLTNGTIRAPSNLGFRLDSCLKHRQPTFNQ